MPQEVQRFREGEDALLEIKRSLERDPRNALRAILEVAEERLAAYAWRLLGFGIDAENMELLKGYRPPKTPEAAIDMIEAGMGHTFNRRVLDAKKDLMTAVVVSMDPYGVRRDPYQAMAEAVQAAFEEVPAYYGAAALSATDDRIKEHFTRKLGAWTRTHVSDAANPRLRHIMEQAARETGLSLEMTKLLNILPASLITFEDWQRQEHEPLRPGSGGTSYVSRVARELEGVGSEQALRPERLEYVDPDAPERGGEDEDLEATEAEADRAYHGRMWNLRMDRARLSERERQVVEIVREGLVRKETGYTNAEIAERLSEVAEKPIAEGTIKALKSRAFGKLRAVSLEDVGG
jgi:DNA-binding CsgD family transcriptional regulator